MNELRIAGSDSKKGGKAAPKSAEKKGKAKPLKAKAESSKARLLLSRCNLDAPNLLQGANKSPAKSRLH